jgi:hypothetical protein
VRPWALAAVAVIVSGAAARAEPCGRDFKSFWDKLEQGSYQGLSPERLAALSRMALAAYDACLAGDGREALLLFGKLALLQDERDRSTGPYNPNLPSR